MSGVAASDCCRTPAEWEPQSCVWLSWPHNLETWPGVTDSGRSRFEAIPGFFARWSRLVAESTPVRILASGQTARQATDMLNGADNVELVDIPTNDCWIRDCGPSFVINETDGTVQAVNWRYNAWGGKYAPWDLDQAITPQLCRAADLPWADSSLCLEGGALEVDGRGRLLTTPDCLLNDNRNPGWSKDQISLELHSRLGVTEIVWLDGGGLAGDDTDGHIDQLARFVDRENVVVAVANPDRGVDAHSLSLEDNYRQLQLWGDSTSPLVQVHRLPIPPARWIDQRRVPESYCNFLRLGTERLLVPTFGAKSDDHAAGLLRELTGADVTGIDCRDLVWGLGALHCASRDQPAPP